MSQFLIGEIENAVIQTFEQKSPDTILIVHEILLIKAIFHS
ncbi:MAG: hypothetical protein ACRC1Z_11020 [Waterburya sp.]